MDDDYLPTFILVDDITGEQVEYTEPYTLQITAGGLPNSQLTQYDDTLARVNSLTWAPLIELPQLSNGLFIFNSTTKGLAFACSSGSPCSSVFPQFPDPAEFWFEMSFSTLGAGANYTYCNYKLTYSVRLFGISVDFLTSILVTLVTLGIALLLVFSIAYVKHYKQKKSLLAVAPADGLGYMHDEGEPLLNTASHYQQKTITFEAESSGQTPSEAASLQSDESPPSMNKEEQLRSRVQLKTILNTRAIIPEES
jgi:hypothetical protein